MRLGIDSPQDTETVPAEEDVAFVNIFDSTAGKDAQWS